MSEDFGHFFSLITGAQLSRIRGKPKYHFMDEAFTPHYESNILPDVQLFELNRMRALKTCRSRCLISMVVGLPLLGLITFLAFKYMDKIDEAPFFIAMLIIIGLWTWSYSPVRKYKSSVKGQIFPKVFQFYGPEFKYSENSPMSVASLERSGIIPNHNKSLTVDYVKGVHQDVTIEFTEAVISEVRGSGKRRREVIIFKGIFILLSMNKNFKGQTIVKRDGGAIGNWFSKKTDGMQNVKLEDPVFEKMFEVHSTDQIEARYLLTPSFMERTLELSRRFGGESLQCSFYNNNLLLMIPSKKNWFETSSIFVPATFVTDINDIILQMRQLFKIIDILKLQERTGL